MSTQPQDVMDEDLGYEDTLKYSQRIRRRIVGDYMDGDYKDPKNASIVLKALKDLDTNALEHKKNSIEEGNADSSRKVAESMREFIQLQKNRNPFEKDADGRVAGIIPQLDHAQLGDYETVPGEEEIGVVIESSSDFMTRMNAKRESEYDEEKDE